MRHIHAHLTAHTFPTNLDWKTETLPSGRVYRSTELPEIFPGVLTFAHVLGFDFPLDRALVGISHIDDELRTVCVGVPDTRFDIIGRWDEIVADAQRITRSGNSPL